MNHSSTDLRGLVAAVEGMCHAAGEVHLRHFRKLKGYEKKGAIDLLTIADKESEARVVAEIRDRFPSHGILAEEGSGAGGGESDYLWIIDPLDGTTNFAHGMPIFAVSIGVQFQGKTIAGGIHAAALGETYLAGHGLGATRNGESLSVSRVDRLGDAMIVTGFPYDRLKYLDWLSGMFSRFLAKGQGMLRLGAASMDLAFVAAGNIDMFYEINLHPWDMAAGALLVEEAGGRMSNFAGEPFDVFSKRMVASNGRIHDEVLAVLAEDVLD